MLESQCIPDLANEVKQVRAKVADIREKNASAKVTPVKGRGNKRQTVAENRVNALEEELKNV